MTGEIRNPAKLPTELYPAEKEFVRCLAEGEFCIVGNGKLPGPEEELKSGEGANVVRGEVIRFFAFGGGEKYRIPGPIIHLRGAWISGDLNLTHASIPYALLLSHCHFAVSVRMLHAECAALYLNGSRLTLGLTADGLTTKGNVNLRSGFSTEGEVRLLGANIGGGLDCTGGKFNNSDGGAFSADGLTTKRNVNLRKGFSAAGEVRLVDANIGGNLDCEGGEFLNSGGDALHADGLTTKGNVNLWKGFSAKGAVRLGGANIGGNLHCTGGEFHNAGGDALYAHRLTTKGIVNLNRGFYAEGAVRLVGANIGGNLNCAGGEFHNLSGDALSAYRLTAKGNVNLSEDFFVEGAVRLRGANIGGNLHCTGGEFHNVGKDVLSADRLTVKGNINLNGGFSAKGAVRLVGANVGGSLNCTGGEFHNLGGNALNIHGGYITRDLLWRKTTGEGVVNLAYGKAEVLADDSHSWESCKVILDGFTYNRFSNPMNAKFRIGWLAKRRDGMDFSPLPYEQAAKVLFGMGHVRDAREILLEKERLQTKNGEMSWPRKVGRRFWDVFAGYGYRLRYTMLWMFGIVVLCAGLFGFAARHNQIVPHQPAVLASEKYKKALEANPIPMEAMRTAFPGEYPEFTPLAFSLDVFIPLFALHQEPFWAPASNKDDDLWKSSILLALLLAALAALLASAWLAQECHKRIRREKKRRKQSSASSLMGAGIGMAFLVFMLGIVSAVGGAHIFWDFEIVWLAGWRWLTVWYWIEIIAGWILTSLFLLSVTGLLRPRQSSGERD